MDIHQRFRHHFAKTRDVAELRVGIGHDAGAGGHDQRTLDLGDKHSTDTYDYDGGNWAMEWQDSHTEGVYWYYCSPAHTQPLNGNLKAYAAWWLWARLAGWAGPEA